MLSKQLNESQRTNQNRDSPADIYSREKPLGLFREQNERRERQRQNLKGDKTSLFKRHNTHKDSQQLFTFTQVAVVSGS